MGEKTGDHSPAHSCVPFCVFCVFRLSCVFVSPFEKNSVQSTESSRSCVVTDVDMVLIACSLIS